jgi:hypothetical protein
MVNGITGEAADYVLIGGSNAYNLRSVLQTKGRKAIQLTKKGMRVRQDTANKLCKQIVDGVDESMVVIIMATDNLAYLFEESHLPKKDDKGKHHVHGQVKLTSAKQIRKIMQKLLPVLQLLKKNRKIILIPLPRYVCLPCCLEEGHCSNRKERDYLTRLLD